jgi:hypothetical protein
LVVLHRIPPRELGIRLIAVMRGVVPVVMVALSRVFVRRNTGDPVHQRMQTITGCVVPGHVVPGHVVPGHVALGHDASLSLL